MKMEKNFVYRGIADDLRTAITLGKYSPDEMIPSENSLAAQYGTSRVTVRKALDLLENEGLIRPQHGKGYFVMSPEYSRFQLDFVDKPEKGGTRYLEINVIPADAALSERFRVREDTMFVMIRRLLLENGAPCAYDEKYFPYVKGEPLIERELHYAQFPDVFTDRYVPRGIWTNMEINTAAAAAHVSAALGCAEGQTLLLVRRTIYANENTPIGFGQRWYAQNSAGLNAISNYYTGY